MILYNWLSLQETKHAAVDVLQTTRSLLAEACPRIRRRCLRSGTTSAVRSMSACLCLSMLISLCQLDHPMSGLAIESSQLPIDIEVVQTASIRQVIGFALYEYMKQKQRRPRVEVRVLGARWLSGGAGPALVGACLPIQVQTQHACMQ